MTPHRFVHSLTPEEQREIEDLFRHGSNTRTRRRAQAVRLSARGYPVPEIADILGCNPQSVHNWLGAFESQGAAGLIEKPRSGRPVVATPDYRSRLVEAVQTDPMKMGYPFSVWTVTRLRAHVARETGILLGETRVRQIMKEEGLVFKRPKHTLAEKRDPKAFAEVQAILDHLKKSPWNPVPE
jgi:transposase